MPPPRVREAAPAATAVIRPCGSGFPLLRFPAAAAGFVEPLDRALLFSFFLLKLRPWLLIKGFFTSFLLSHVLLASFLLFDLVLEFSLVWKSKLV